MDTQKRQIDSLLKDLQERAKELNCLYKVEELLSDANIPLDRLFQGIIDIIPLGWQYPEICQAKITYNNETYRSSNFKETPYVQSADIVVQDKIVGQIAVSYVHEIPLTKNEYFLKEEKKLIQTIADRLGHVILHQEWKKVFMDWEGIKKDQSKEKICKWLAIVDTLKRSDKKLFIHISQKMFHYLCWNGVEEAKKLLQKYGTTKRIQGQKISFDMNRPSQKLTVDYIFNLSKEIFQIAAKNLNENQTMSLIQKWIQEDKSSFLVRAVENPNSSLTDIINAITRFRYMESGDIALSPSMDKGLRVSLVRRFLSDHLAFIRIAKDYIDVHDYFDLVQKIIFPVDSRGTLGGKGAGLFLATKILEKFNKSNALLTTIQVPNTWYITSDGLTTFLQYNNFDEVIEHKYKEIDEIRIEYPNIIQIFKNSHFPPEIVKGLSIAIDNLGNHPIIVRSSSLLEDRAGAIFSGKYKSLFLANQGSKEQRLDALMDAIAEVYASTFAPDPIEYRAERGLLDINEEMGILIQQVVGNRIGHYFIPDFAGVAFSNNEFRWSPRIRREDGLIRIVPGLGTRAVDRLSDDYPVLIAPGKPELRVNVILEEILRYSTKKVDVINLKKNAFETIPVSDLFNTFGQDMPNVHHIVSILKDNIIQKQSSPMGIHFGKDDLIVTFEGLISQTPFVKQIRTLLDLLQEKIGNPVDIEFAHDGRSLYLLQCRSQSRSIESSPSPIPKNIPKDKIVFSANRYISNGFVPDIHYIVYVDPEAYAQLSEYSQLLKIGEIVSRLNKILPKRKFILMGPGRWGSRGDIKLGVNVTYSDINNTAMIVEIARKKGNYLPELSFGTHFFQDLVESSIRYLPLYPDEPNILFNEQFLSEENSILSDLAPEFLPFAKTVRVIHIPKTADGSILRVLMNAELEKAIGYLTNASDHPISLD